jgi:hypothetical protein
MNKKLLQSDISAGENMRFDKAAYEETKFLKQELETQRL